MNDIRIHSSWKKQLQHIFATEEFNVLRKQVRQAYATSRVFPPARDIFAAFDNTPFEQVKVVVLGQDPYHGEGQAHGLSFSVAKPTLPPPSLLNIFKEIEDDLTCVMSRRAGDLRDWAKQGVLLLNSILTVKAGHPGSHKDFNWQIFTDAVIQILAEKHENLVFMLWGNFAKAKVSLLPKERHLILTASHPSPMSAHNGFLGCRHFSLCNSYLIKHNKKPINWIISD